MKIVYKENEKRIILIVIIVITLFFAGLFAQSYIYRYFPIENKDNLSNNEELFLAQDSINDTAAPIITFIQPSLNNTLIIETSYFIIVHISDDNPPLYGNVTVQISNETNVFFSSKMNNTDTEFWRFTWDNISLYPNQEVYIFQVLAIDSSSNGNYNWSNAYYVFINTSIEDPPPLLNLILYFIAVTIIFALIIVYLNKKGIYKLRKKELGDDLIEEE
ncbi:MAG: hypothetical protein HWN81_15585 [Candidatus Lokiarchaeota archaeon]|nr:hypothetical protein [Candidatus Lokiarchaeota archaeon]